MRVWRCLMYGLILQMLVMGIGLAEERSEEIRRDTVRLPPKRHTIQQLGTNMWSDNNLTTPVVPRRSLPS